MRMMRVLAKAGVDISATAIAAMVVIFFIANSILAMRTAPNCHRSSGERGVARANIQMVWEHKRKFSDQALLKFPLSSREST